MTAAFVALFSVLLVFTTRAAPVAAPAAAPRPLPALSDLASPFIMDVDNSSATVPTAKWFPALLPSGRAFNLYGWVGLMPRINADGSFVNGGVPQAGNLTTHLAKLRRDLSALLPANASGACLLDWEFWRADFGGTGAQYRNASIALAGGDAAAAAAAYEAGARVFLEGSLRAVATYVNPRHTVPMTSVVGAVTVDAEYTSAPPHGYGPTARPKVAWPPP